MSPTAASTGSASTIATPATTSMNSTPIENGSGLKTMNEASMSLLALDSSWPVGWRWCHDSGSRRYCDETRRR